MKKLFLLAIILISCSLFAQDWDDDKHEREHHKKEKYNKDYFSLGLYGGEYQNFGSRFSEPSYVMNAIALELEYTKNKNFSFFVKALYQNTYNDIKKMTGLPGNAYDIKDPFTYRVVIDFGAKYYAGNKNPRLYFQLGLSHDMLSIGKYSYKIPNYYNIYYQYDVNAYQYNNLSIDAGAGLKIKISRRFNIDIQYDVYKNLNSGNSGLFANGMLAGIKYDF